MLNFFRCHPFHVLFLLGALVARVYGATADEWRSHSIYQVLTDRFGLADNSTTKSCSAALAAYCGGGWRGIINRLDYIQGMGFTAVWISPVTYQFQGSSPYGEAYHGYWQQDINRLNSNFGTEEDLKDLAGALHARGMYLMLDVVVNHYAWRGGPFLGAYSQLKPFDDSKYYHNPCLISQIPDANSTTLQNCWLGDDIVALPDLDTQSPYVASTLGSWIKGLVDTYSIDGLRIDSVLNVEPSFFPDFLEAAGVFATGETMSGNATMSCAYTHNSLPSVLNYPVYYPLTRAFASPQGSLEELVADIAWVNRSCSDPTTLTMFSENHDVPRFASITKDLALASNVLTYVILQPGIPIIYYGAEQHLSGSTVLSGDRQALWPTEYNTSAPLYQMLGKLNGLRSHASAQSNYASSQSYVAWQDSNTIAFIRGAGNIKYSTVIVLTNNGASAGPYTINVPTPFGSETNMTDVLSCRSVLVSSSGVLAAKMNGGMPQAYFPTESLDGSGLCGASKSAGSGGYGSEPSPGPSSTSPGSVSPSASGSSASNLSPPSMTRLAWQTALALWLGYAASGFSGESYSLIQKSWSA